MKNLLVSFWLMLVFTSVTCAQGIKYDGEYSSGQSTFVTGPKMKYGSISIDNKNNVNLGKEFVSTTVLEPTFDQQKTIEAVMKVLLDERLRHLIESEPRPQFRVWFFFDRNGVLQSVSFVFHKNTGVTFEEMAELDVLLKEVRFSDFLTVENDTSDYFNFTVAFRYEWILNGRLWKK